MNGYQEPSSYLPVALSAKLDIGMNPKKREGIMQNTSHCREKAEGWRGRRRNYKCRECGVKFQDDVLKPLPEIDRVCFNCRMHTIVYTFVNPTTGQEMTLRAPDVELANLRAWKINPSYILKAWLSKETVNNNPIGGTSGN